MQMPLKLERSGDAVDGWVEVGVGTKDEGREGKKGAQGGFGKWAKFGKLENGDVKTTFLQGGE